jgi:hypothetical protein
MAIPNCLQTGCPVKRPEPGHTLAPWVQITFLGSGSVITVGNDSSPNTNPQHVACIKSFEFGYSDGMTCRCTIQDQQGGSFVAFMQNLLTDFMCLEGSASQVYMKLRFGWSKANCPGTAVSYSPIFYLVCIGVETNFSEGKYTFEITAYDQCRTMWEGSVEKNYGGEGDQGMYLTEAIRKLMTNECSPNVSNVKFLRKQGGVIEPLEFDLQGEERAKGPKNKWVCNGQNKMEVVKQWLQGYLTSNKKGFILAYDGEVIGGELIVWEDPKPKTPTDDWDQSCIGVYVVNGGKESPVIEFNPKVKWDFSRLTSQGGNVGSERLNAMGTDGSKNPGRDIPTIDRESYPCAGHNIQTDITDAHRDIFGSRATKKKAEGDDQNQRAMRILPDPIEADLVIVGDPTLPPPSRCIVSHNVSIIFVNPFHLTMGGDRCGEWLASPVCNEVLTNKAWMVKSVTHRIEAGKYTTTIGVHLVGPGDEAPVGSPIGAWTGGWRPVNC